MKRIPILLALCLAATCAYAQGVVGVKTNLLYGAATLTPNLGAEIGLGRHTTLELSGSYNPWNLNGTQADNTKLVHWIGQAEFRYFTCERFNGHFLGVHGLYSMFNIGGHELPLLLGKGSKEYRYEGSAYGAGLSYGYQFVLGRHWNLELSVGVGYMQIKYDQYDCPHCGDLKGQFTRNYIGPTKAAVSLIYIIK